MKIEKYLFLGLAAIVITSSCKKKNDDPQSVVVEVPTTPITCQTTHLKGYMSGTICSGNTYYLDSNMYVKKGETLTIQPGATIIATKLTAGIYVSGNIISNGTQAQPVVFTASQANQDPTWGGNITGYAGGWGGIQCDSTAQLVQLTYTKVMWTGGPDLSGGAQYSLAVHGKPTSANTKVIIEDCIFYGGGDDGLRLEGPIKISVRRNMFQHMGSSDGDNINIKRGVTGDVAYNYIWSAANNSVKLESSIAGDFAPYTNVNIYNNTIVSGGYRKTGEPTAGILIDNYAFGSVYNNIFMNNHQGLRITKLAKPVAYGNNLFYSTTDSTRSKFYPAGDAATKQVSDLVSTGVDNLNPMFMIFDTDMNANADANNPHLKSGSPALGKGNVNAPFNSFGINNTKPSIDFGAFPSDNSGNQFAYSQITSNGK